MTTAGVDRPGGRNATQSKDDVPVVVGGKPTAAFGGLMCVLIAVGWIVFLALSIGWLLQLKGVH